jgi:mono/diheme cytochrome c family protein
MNTVSLMRRNLFRTGKLAAATAATITSLALFVIPAPGQGSPAEATFIKSIQPFFAKNCYACHGPRLSSGGLNLEAYTSAALFFQDRDESEKILKKLQAGEMPPKRLPHPNAEDLKAVTNWIEHDLDRQAKTDPVRITARRLNRVEYNNTVRDLLGVDVRPADDFPQDDSAYGFDNIAQALSVSPLLMEKYIATAERIARTAVFGPNLKTLTSVYLPPLPRRMETTNRTLVPFPAYYSMTNYDATGLSQPGSFHVTHIFPADGEYLIRIAGAGFRPTGSEPGQMTFWLDGKLVRTFQVDVDVEQSGFERRPDHWDVRMKIAAGAHELVAAFPNQFDGLPALFRGPNPSQRPFDPCKLGPAGGPQCLAAALKALDDPNDGNANPTTPERIARRNEAIQSAKEAASRTPTFNGLSVHEVDITGPYEFKEGPSPESLRKIYTCGHLDGHHQPSCQRKIIANLAYRAFRGPVSPEKVDRIVAISDGARKRGGSFEEGISLAIASMLASPNFLFRIEGPAVNSQGGQSAGQYAVASKLSYFLWSSMPDDELLGIAEKGMLRNPEVRNAQARRMLADPKAWALVENFAGQWLEIRRLESAQPDRERFPDFDEYLRASMLKETELFFQYVIREDRSILDFIDGPYSFMNERLARHYGISGVRGSEFRKVDLSGTGRGGVLTQASVLEVSSYGNRTSPVLRGKWILDNILNSPPPPPPANVPSLDEDAVGSSASLRQQLEQHRKNAVCASCHARMDPLGFGFENFDAVGAWRTLDGKFPIDASGVLPDGKAFRGADELKVILRQQKDIFAEGLTEKLLTYALGRGLDRADQPAVKQIVTRMAASGYKFSSLLLGIVDSAPFQMRGEGVAK